MMIENLKELIDDIVSEVSFRTDSGLVDFRNGDHIYILSEVLTEMGLGGVKDELISALTEADEDKPTDEAEDDKYSHKAYGYYVKKGDEEKKDAQLFTKQDGRYVPSSPEEYEKAAAEQGEKGAESPDADKAGDGEGSEDGGVQQAQPEKGAALDPNTKGGAAWNQNLPDGDPAKVKVDPEKPKGEKEDGGFKPIDRGDVKKEIPNADSETFSGDSDIPDGVKPDVLEKFNTDIQKVAQQVADAKAKGEPAPNINLCTVTVPGTNLYCDNNLGIPRDEMPQFKGTAEPGSRAASMKSDAGGEVDTEPVFREMLKEKGIKTLQTEIPADKLKATQKDLVGAKVVGMLGALDKDPNHPAITAPIYVSRDGYVIDGHHRWAAVVAYNAANPDNQIPMKTTVIDMDIKDAIPMANKFAEDIGIAAKKADANKEAPTEKKPEEVADNLKNRTTTEGEKLDIETTDGGSLIIGVEHGEETESTKKTIQQITSLPKDTKVMFVGEGGMSKDDEGNFEFVGEQDEIRNAVKGHFSNAEESSWDENANVYDDTSPVYDEVAKSLGGNKSKAKASIWSNMVGQGDDMSADDYLDDEGKEWLIDQAKAGGSDKFDGEVDWDNLTDEQRDDLYQLNFRDDENYGETEISKGQESYNNFRQKELDRKIKEAEADGYTVIAPVGNSHVDMWRDRNKGGSKKTEPESTDTKKLPEPKEPSTKDGGRVYSLGGGYYSDTPNGPAQYRVVESVVEEVLINGNESHSYLLFEAAVTKTTAGGNTVKLVTIDKSKQKAATKVANQAEPTKTPDDSKTSDDRINIESVNNSQETFNTNPKFSEPGMVHEERVKKLKNMNSKEINSVKIEDIYREMGVKVGNVKFPPKYISVLTNALNFANGRFTITDLTDAAGAGTLESTLGELITLIGSTIQDVDQRNSFFKFLREQVKAGNNSSPLTIAWINSAQDSSEAFHRKLSKDCPGGHEVKTNFWDIPSEAEGAGVKNYKRDKGKSTDINTLVDCIGKDGSRSTRWMQPSLKKGKKVNAFNSTTGRVFATTVLRWATPQEKEQYSVLGNELDSFDGLEDNAPAGSYTITDKKGNTRPMTIKERKTQINKEMRKIESLYEDKIPAEANPKQAIVRQAAIHDDYLNDSNSLKERDEFIRRWRDMTKDERRKLTRKIAKSMAQKDKYVEELEEQLDKLSQYDSLTSETLREGGFTTSKDRQKIMLAVMTGVIETSDDGPNAAEFKEKLIQNSHNHSNAVLEYLISDSENKKALLENISTAFPLKDLMEGKEWAILGEKGGGINLDKDTITQCLGVDKFEDVVEKLIIVDYKGEPTLAYASDNGERTVPIGQINCRPDGIGYGSSWKLELSIHSAFADCCKEYDK